FEQVVAANLYVLGNDGRGAAAKENALPAGFEEVVHDLQGMSRCRSNAATDCGRVRASSGLGGTGQTVEVGVNHGHIRGTLDAHAVSEFRSIVSVNPVSVEDQVVAAICKQQACHSAVGGGSPFDSNKTIVIAKLNPAFRLHRNRRHQLGCASGWLSKRRPPGETSDSCPRGRDAPAF